MLSETNTGQVSLMTVSPAPQSKLSKDLKEGSAKKDKKKGGKREALAVSLPAPPHLRKLEGRSRLVDITLHPKLRIIKRDIRRRYSEMFNNVVNHPDPRLLLEFFQQFCTPDCQYIVTVAPQISVPVRVGPRDIFCQQMEYRKTIPDGIRYLTDSKICVSLDQPGSRIISNIFFKGTEIFQIIPEEGFHKLSVSSSDFVPYSSDSDVTDDDQTTSISSDTPRSVEQYRDDTADSLIAELDALKLEKVRQPREINLRGVFIFDLDEHNRLVKLSMDITTAQVKDISITQL